MRILITGATGLIGQEVGKKLVLSGHELVVTARNPERARLALPFPAKIVKWAGYTEELPQEAVSGIDGVINLAGEPIAEGRWTAQRKIAIRNSRTLGTKALLEALKKSGNQKLQFFLQGSAIGFYGHRTDEVLNEQSEVGSGFLPELVRDWEMESDAISQVIGTNVRLIKLRTGVVLSRRGGALAKMLPVFSRGVGGKLGSGQQWFSWIHIEDIVGLIQFAVESSQVDGILNGVAPEPARNERFTVALARALGRPVFLPVPEAALKIALGEMASALLDSQRVLPQRAEELGYQFQYRELTAALQELCTPLYKGVHEIFMEQWVPGKPEEVFPYFCSEKNLEELTPPFLNFHVVGKSTPEIAEGTLIDYQLKLYGVPMKWRTLIESWQPGHQFVDLQLKGPYKLWRHTHEFIPMAGGTLLRDQVLYQLPMGYLGDVFGSWKVSSDVGTIFSYRRKKVVELFGVNQE